jgi:DNA-directed RNA polymerase specialized sigma24 family protein
MEPESLPLPPELEAILEIIDQGGEKVLSQREKKAFQLVVREGLSYRKAAAKMGCSFHSVEQYVKRAAVKLRKLCQTKL